MRRNPQQLGAAFLTSLYAGTGGLSQATSSCEGNLPVSGRSLQCVALPELRVPAGGGGAAQLADGCRGAEAPQAEACSSGHLGQHRNPTMSQRVPRGTVLGHLRQTGSALQYGMGKTVAGTAGTQPATEMHFSTIRVGRIAGFEEASGAVTCLVSCLQQVRCWPQDALGAAAFLDGQPGAKTLASDLSVLVKTEL